MKGSPGPRRSRHHGRPAHAHASSSLRARSLPPPLSPRRKAQSRPMPRRSASPRSPADSRSLGGGVPAGRRDAGDGTARRLRLIEDGRLRDEPVAGVPEVHARRQGGLLDVAVDPEFERNWLIYLSYAHEQEDGETTTRVMRAVLAGRSFGSAGDLRGQAPGRQLHALRPRLAFGNDGSLYVTMGERYSQREKAQDLGTHLGKVLGSTRTARCRRTTRSWVARVPCPRSSPTATATRRVLWSTRATAGCGRTSTAPRAATKSTSSRPAPTTAGRRSHTASTTTAAQSAPVGPRRPASSRPCSTGTPRSRPRAWPSISAIASRAGGAICWSEP